MAYRYRGPGGKFARESTYNRSRAQGGKSYRREKISLPQSETLGDRVQKVRSTIKDYAELGRLYEQFDSDWIDGDFEDQGEYETGVDYGEE